jgi:hypothetical protein
VSQRRQVLLFFGLVISFALVGYVLGRPHGSAPGLFDTVPRGAWLVARVDVAALQGSALVKPLKPLFGAGDKLPGLGDLTGKCGFDPVARLREVIVTSPEAGERGDFGVAFTGDFSMSELAACADAVIRSRGGTPATSSQDGFTLVEDTSDPLHARVAYREGGPYLVGRGAWLDAMIRATLGKGERAGSEHADLRAAIAPKAGASPSVVVVTALLPDTVRDKLKGELGSEAAGGGEGDASFAGVLGVSAVGLAAGTGGPGSTTELTLELRCESASACDEVDKLIDRKRASFSRDIGVRLVGLGPLLDSLALHPRGAALSVTASAPTDELARALQRVLDYRGHASRPRARDNEGVGGSPSTSGSSSATASSPPKP